jgi:hypothetical protein
MVYFEFLRKPLPVGLINGLTLPFIPFATHEGIGFYQMDSGTDDEVLVQGVYPAAYNITQNIQLTFSCYWAVAVAAPTKFKMDWTHIALGGDTTVWTDPAPGTDITIPLGGAKDKINVGFTIGPGSIAPGEEFKFRFHRNTEANGVDLLIEAISLELV